METGGAVNQKHQNMINKPDQCAKTPPLADAIVCLEKIVSETEELISSMHDRLTVIRLDEPPCPPDLTPIEVIPVPMIRDRIQKLQTRMAQVNGNLSYNLRTIEI